MDHGVAPGEQIPFTDDLLHRQIPFSWTQQGRPCEYAFRPGQRDDGELSVSWGKLVAPREAYERHISNGYKSDAVFSLTVGEFQVEELPSQFKPVEENPAHAIVSYKHIPTKADQKVKSFRLREHAISRGATYLPDNSLLSERPTEPEN